MKEDMRKLSTDIQNQHEENSFLCVITPLSAIFQLYRVFIAKYPFTGSEKILNNIVFKIAIKFISMRNSEISNCLYSKKLK
jgi:hypothetical protein